MKISEFANSSGEWLKGQGPDSDVVISSRIRLARNLVSFFFLPKCTDAQKCQIVETVSKVLHRVDPKLNFLRLDQAEDIDRQVLVERHLISRQHAGQTGARLVAFSPDERLAVMINEEDHLRIQVIRSGLQFEQAWAQIDQFDDRLEEHLDYAFDAQFGYLTACPTNVGTGLRISAMLHLPGLRLTRELDRVFRAAKDMRLAVRGLYGEGTEAVGDFFQISNQITLGYAEREIVSDFSERVVPPMVAYERKARRSLLQDHVRELDDKVFRAAGLLRNARVMGAKETLSLLSHLRIGIALERIRGVEMDTVNDLLLQTQPAHLQQLQGQSSEGGQMSAVQRRIVRAEVIRSRLNGFEAKG